MVKKHFTTEKKRIELEAEIATQRERDEQNRRIKEMQESIIKTSSGVLNPTKEDTERQEKLAKLAKLKALREKQEAQQSNQETK